MNPGDFLCSFRNDLNASKKGLLNIFLGQEIYSEAEGFLLPNKY